MKLFFSKGACSLAVRIIINELNIKCEYEAVDLKTKKTTAGEDFLKINPKGAVPTLEIKPNEVLTENCVIQQYLADTHSASKLLAPAPDLIRYRTLEMLNYVSTDIHKGFGPLFNPKVPAELNNDIFKPNLKKKFEYINSQLANKKYVMGEHFTLPDAYLFVVLRWATKMGVDVEGFTHLMKYFDLLQQHPSIVKSVQQEGLA